MWLSEENTKETPEMKQMKRIIAASMMALALVASLVTGASSAQAAQVRQIASAPQYVPLPGGAGLFRIPTGAKPDALAYYHNNFQPIPLASDSLLRWSSLGGIATEEGPAQTIPRCLQPPAHLDVLHTSDALLQEYGITPRGAMSLSKWLRMATAAAKATHACQYREDNASTAPEPAGQLIHSASGGRGSFSAYGYKNPLWAGNVADQNCASNPSNGPACQDGTHNYLETDADYYVECPEYTSQIYSTASDAAWVGLGGIDHNHELNQVGTAVSYTQGTGSNFNYSVLAFWEFVGAAGTVGERQVTINLQPVTASCPRGGQGDHMFAEMSDDAGWGVYWLEDLTQGWDFQYTDPFDPGPSTTSAEQILEDVNGGNGYGSFLNANTTFYGAGVTDTKHSPNYIGYNTAQHDYQSVYFGGTTYPTDVVLNPGPIVNDPGDSPYDQYTVTVFNPCGPFNLC